MKLLLFLLISWVTLITCGTVLIIYGHGFWGGVLIVIFIFSSANKYKSSDL